MYNYTKELDYKVLKEELKPHSTFEHHILQCCRAPEFQLREWLKKALVKAGFALIEDNYKTERVHKDKRYESVHNLLAIRGNPDVCLVAHTDVCREHEEKTKSRDMNNSISVKEWNDLEKFMGRTLIKSEAESIWNKVNDNQAYRVTPVVKTVQHKTTKEVRRIIQDRLCKFQVGGDDRLGVAIISWIALNTGYDMGLYFPTDEEIGLKSARACEIPQLKEFELLVQVDRGNHSRELVVKINNEVLCSHDIAIRLLKIAYQIGLPRTPVTGASTDVYALKSRNMCKNAVNMTCGYHNSIGSDPTEYIDIQEARDTMKYVDKIVADFYVKGRQ